MSALGKSHPVHVGLSLSARPCLYTCTVAFGRRALCSSAAVAVARRGRRPPLRSRAVFVARRCRRPRAVVIVARRCRRPRAVVVVARRGSRVHPA